MKTIRLEISDNDFQKYDLDFVKDIKFTDLVEKISLEFARKSLLECNQIAEETGLSKMSMDEINTEIKAVRNAKNNT